MVTLLNVWKAYRASNKSGGWCQEQFLISRHLQFAVEVRKQLVELCHNCGVRCVSRSRVTVTCHVSAAGWRAHVTWTRCGGRWRGASS